MTVKPLPALVRWVIPALMLVFCVVCEFVVPTEAKPAFFSEGGPVERMQEIILALAVIYAGLLTWKVQGRWLKAWFGVAALSCIYVLGEEISWGQMIFYWETPELWGAINDQNETNLHNTSTWLDQKPKVILQIGVLVGGLIIPALQKWKPSALPTKFTAIYPTAQVSVAAGFALAVKLIETAQDITGDKLFWRPSEVLEIYIYYFVMIYLLEMWKRFKPEKL